MLIRTRNSEKIPYHVDVKYSFNADLVIAGGGVAGCCAAIAAARTGVKVLLVEQSGCLGGMATNGHVSPLSSVETLDGKSFGGLMAEIITTLREESRQYGGGTCDTIVAPHLLKHVLLTKAADSGVGILFHAALADAFVKDKKIEAVLLNTKSGLTAAAAKAFIDATGDGDLIAFSRESFSLGSEPGVFDALVETGLDQVHFEEGEASRYGAYSSGGAVQPVSVMFTMGGVDAKKGAPYINKQLVYGDLGVTEEIFDALPYAGTPGFEKNGNLIPLPQGRILFFDSARESEVVVNMSRITRIDGTDPRQLSRAEVLAQRQVIYIVDFLKRFVPGFENGYLLESAGTLGVRETRRLLGQYVFRGKDAINCPPFKDVIAHGAYIIDIHDPFGKRKAIGGSIKGNCYSIPYRSLVPKTIVNMLVCGRCISADHVAHASTRIQGTCMLTGQAAGTAAALALKAGAPVPDVNVKELQDQLVQDGVYLQIQDRRS